MIVACSAYFLHKMQWENFRSALSESSRVLLGAGFVLLFTVPMVRILINSGVNAADIPSMPIAWHVLLLTVSAVFTLC